MAIQFQVRRLILLILPIFFASIIMGQQEEVDFASGSSAVILSSAAALSIERDDIDLLIALQKAGWNNHQVLRGGKTFLWHERSPLHWAVLMRSELAVKWLLQEGANRFEKDKFGALPIEYILEPILPHEKRICELLAVDSDHNEKLALNVLRNTVKRKIGITDMVVFIKVEGEPANKEWLGCFRGLVDSVYDSNFMEIGEWYEAEKDRQSSYRHTKTNKLGLLLDVTKWEKKSKNKYLFSFNCSSGTLSGGGMSGKIVNYYGYWIAVVEKSWDS